MKAAALAAFIEIHAAIGKARRDEQAAMLHLSEEALAIMGIPPGEPVQVVAVGNDCAIVKEPRGYRLIRLGTKNLFFSSAADVSSHGQIKFLIKGKPRLAQLQGKSFFLDGSGRQLNLTNFGESIPEIANATPKERRNLTTICSSSNGRLRIEADKSMSRLFLCDDKQRELFQVTDTTQPYQLISEKGEIVGTLSFEGLMPKAIIKSGTSQATTLFPSITNRWAYSLLLSKNLLQVASYLGNDLSEHRLYANRADNSLALVSNDGPRQPIRFFLGRLESSTTGFKRIAFTLSHDKAARLVATAALRGESITVGFSRDRKVPLRVLDTPDAIDFVNRNCRNRPGSKSLDVFDLSDPDDIESSIDRELAELSAKILDDEPNDETAEIDEQDEVNLRRADIHRG